MQRLITDALQSEARRRVREDVRVEEERLNPSGGQRRDSAKLFNGVRRTDERGLRSMIIVAGGNQCDCATVINSIGVWMNPLVELRGSTQGERPKECRENANCNKCAPMIS
jgi:hypothetical protein